MEKFKAVEKEMKTKAFSKEGLNAAAKLDPKEKEKNDVCNFIQEMLDELERQIEALEAEAESLQAGLKKGKKDSGKSDRTAALESRVETHKWHISKLELLLRSVENDGVGPEEVKDIETDIKYYVETNQEMDFMEDEGIYDALSLEEDEALYGMPTENDKVSSQDAQSIQDEPPDTEEAPQAKKPATKSKSISETTTRRPSVQLKSTSQPLPPLATLQSIPSSSNTKAVETMKPAVIPVGQPLKYASAAAAAAANTNGVGIAPLPPPPGGARTSATSSPAVTAAQPAAPSPVKPAEPQPSKVPEQPVRQPVPEPKAAEPESTPVSSAQASKVASVKPSPQVSKAQPTPEMTLAKIPQPPSPDSGISGIALSSRDVEEEEEESIYHLPASLADLLESFEETKQRGKSDQAFDPNMLNASRLSCPTPMDAENPNHYRPQNPYAYTPPHYPQEPLGIFDDPRLYSRIDPDSLFYAFYYRQGTYQQYLAAKALKGQSWRFHKQYQTWFQRHEEPKNITEEFEQGTYRFFDYESTW